MDVPERFFISPPVLTPKVRTTDDGQSLAVYLDDKGNEVLWSGEFALPPLDSEVFITTNNIGWAIVKGYFVSAGYLGVMTLPLNPPLWLLMQCFAVQKNVDSPEWAKQGIGCEFGSELSQVVLPAPAISREVALTLLYCLETFEAACQCGMCDPCTRGREDIKRAISLVENLDVRARRSVGNFSNGRPAETVPNGNCG